MDLTTPLTYVKGIGPGRAAMLEAKGLTTVEDLLGYVPFRYEDRSNMKPIGQLAPGEMATVIADVRAVKNERLQAAQPGDVRSPLHRCVARHPGGQVVPWRLPG
jgi:ATP-dependent DNA helicase RecG